MLISPESPKNSSISCVAFAIACPGGRKATLAPSVGGARRFAPAARKTVAMSRTMIVIQGRTVTTRLIFSSARFICNAQFNTRGNSHI